ncbi:uncharacterized protein N7515_004054 [Penicillium bovifimosum]|uniref:Uncharacterized protein n=1 Tax=Penicillium bovifimosum TaxID=126998 RepID=A0A9W9H7P1_9EURO|nr:uncharacterized protein N7515_004054 [Penicillium bovifimosum]KAJ5139206.1 hypothetical protein N7515_004054 [Penicillium bovifimosum]
MAWSGLKPRTSLRHITLPQVSDLGDLFNWQRNIETTLQHFGLVQLISQQLKGPGADHPDVDKWGQWSVIVPQWLLNTICSIEPELLLSLKRYAQILIYADASCTGIISMTSNHDLHRTGHLFVLWRMHRCQFDTLEGYREQVVICSAFKTGLCYCSAAKVRIYRLQEEVPSNCILAHRLIALYDGDNATMNRAQFDKFVESLITGGMPF